ncbi:G-type lectin S-receptor-like serine/threonine-protein kinase LECRK3 [Chenopodium quinoa]|uniref:non-specific serine/threonine protein kinase n=1 Tax=Chenopodium quinoa TaxID=63459 RepID=A0A803KM06_CHEQI|nr:G-type lectin S-receptor-like serine/threonine-protein kinase LECRK3 [Chenopodium quinoa]
MPDGNLVLNPMDLSTGFAYGAYYTSGTNENPEIAGQRLVYNESGYMFILRKNGSRQDLMPPNEVQSTTDSYQRVTLTFDGMLTWYSIPKASISNGWSMKHALPENICITNKNFRADVGSGICGFNSICSIGDDRRPTCTCPKGYSFLDPNDMFGSCKPDFALESCERYAERSIRGEYRLVPLPNTDWPWNDYERLDPCSEEDCKNSCLKDCFCAAAIFGDVNNPAGCWKKKAPLSNGRRDSTVIGTAWIKVGNVSISNNSISTFVSLPPPTTKNKVKYLNKALIGGSISVNLLLLIAICFGIFFIYHKKQQKVSNEGQRKTLREYSHVHYFSYQELNEATYGFKEELGRGAFGVVYKGMIRGGGPSICVAVKKLDRISSDTDKEFKTEVNVIGQTHHKNLVQLVGFCKEGDQRLLVYEYMSNGSLADYLFGDMRPSWIDRVQIAQGTATGLLYLHEECSTQIIHCDIKPQNILLDEYHNARISDFGLAKLLVLNQTHTNTAIRGTKGYVAPEWFRNKPVTVKVDVYSFGVLLLEIICCRKSVCMELVEEEAAILTDWAFDCYLSNKLDLLVNDDMEALKDIIRLKRFVIVALWCIQEDPSLRPTMRTVTQMLEGLAEVPNNPPCPASFSVTTQH